MRDTKRVCVEVQWQVKCREDTQGEKNEERIEEKTNKRKRDRKEKKTPDPSATKKGQRRQDHQKRTENVLATSTLTSPRELSYTHTRHTPLGLVAREDGLTEARAAPLLGARAQAGERAAQDALELRPDLVRRRARERHERRRSARVRVRARRRWGLLGGVVGE